MNEKLSKSAVKVARDVLADRYLTREELEALGQRAESGLFGSPMDAVNDIAARSGLNKENKLELRRIIIARSANRSIAPGWRVVTASGETGLVVRTTPPVRSGMVLVKVDGGAEQEFYISDLRQAS